MKENPFLQARINQALQLVCRANRKINIVRYSNSESEEHIQAKKDICLLLGVMGKSFVTEARFVTGGRADIFVLDDITIIEIVVSEAEESLRYKAEYYPKGVRIIYYKLKVG